MKAKDTEIKPVRLPDTEKVIYQDIKGHRITGDTQFLVDTILHPHNRFPTEQLKVLEIGTGTGIISILLSRTRPYWRILATEVQIPQFFIASKNIETINTKLQIRLADVRNMSNYIGDERFHLIVSNPPYYKVGSGRTSTSISKNISRFEFLCEMGDMLICIKEHLLPEGIAVYLYPQSREEELQSLINKYRLCLIGAIAVDKDQKDSRSEKKLFLIGKENSSDKRLTITTQYA